MEKEQLNKTKQFADFAISNFYQDTFKPYLNELVNKQYNLLDTDPINEFACMKRDITLWANKSIIRQILDKVDKANDRVSKEIQKDLQTKITKI